MAGDWIKMRVNLWDDPRVSRLCDMTDQGEAAIIGALYWLWSTADQHSTDGIMPGLTLRGIDRKTGVAGFAQALCDIGWLADHPDGVRVLKFHEHNGQSAKRRCLDAQRKANARDVSASDADKDGKACGQDEDEKRRDAELDTEKRREEQKQDQKTTRARRAGAVAPDRPPDVCESVWRDWAQLRKTKRAAVTDTVLEGARREAGKAGLSLEQFLRTWCELGWQGLKADWLPADRKKSLAERAIEGAKREYERFNAERDHLHLDADDFDLRPPMGLGYERDSDG